MSTSFRIPKLVRAAYARSGLFLAFLLSAVPEAGAQGELGKAGNTYPTVAASGAWTFFTDPRAVYHKGSQEKTYCGFIDRVGTVGVWSLDHRTGRTDSFTLHTRLEQDDHDNPALYVRKDGRLTAYYHKHGNDNRVRYRITTRPEDITAWGPEDSLVLPGGVTYSHPFRLQGEADRLYLFNRSIDWHPTVTTSADDGTTWGKPAKVIGGSGARPYIKYVSDGAKRIHMAFTDGHPRDEARNSIYYVYYENGAYRRADGTVAKTVAALPVSPRPDADLVYDGATAGRAWIWDIALDSAGRPVMVYSVSPTTSDHRYHYARWDGQQWRKGEMARAGKWFPLTPAGQTEREPHYAGGIILDHEDPSVVYLSRPTNGVFEIERWQTPDGGATWKSSMVTSGSSRHNVRPVLPWTAPGMRQPRKMLFWMHGDYVHYTDYATSIRYYRWPEVPTAVRGAGSPSAPGPAVRHLPGALEADFGGDASEAQLRDGTGRVVASGESEAGSPVRLATRGLPPGLYLLTGRPRAGGAARAVRVALLP